MTGGLGVENVGPFLHVFEMKLLWLIAIPLLGSLLLSGCRGSESQSPPPVIDTKSTSKTQPEIKSPSRAQPKLQTIKLWLGSEELIVEQAIAAKEIETGMMFREKMEENEGMIFVFAQPHRASFWMRNTLLPLSCAYIDSKGVVREIRDMKPLDESPIEASFSDVQYVLEVNQGWFARHNVSIGMAARTEVGTLKKTYFRASRP